MVGRGLEGVWEWHPLRSVTQPGWETQMGAKLPSGIFLVPTVFFSPCSALARDRK